MIKNMVAPIQMWLLSQKRCVGCGMPLSKGSLKKKSQYLLTTCKCKRVYIQNNPHSPYKRAKINQL